MDRSDELLKLDNQLCFSLYAASKALVSAYKPLLDPLGITYTQYLTLLALWEEDGVTIKHLSHRMHLDSGTLSPLIKRLEASGLVYRDRDPADERRVLVFLTEDGRQLKTRALEIPMKAYEKSGLTPERVRLLKEELTALTAHLETTEED
jgi:DNA-binding MarR family transcriptional regulator